MPTTAPAGRGMERDSEYSSVADDTLDLPAGWLGAARLVPTAFPPSRRWPSGSRKMDRDGSELP